MNLDKKIIFYTPQFLEKPYGWLQHTPFAAFLIESLQPQIFVELGTHIGNSYFAFCQAIDQLKLATKSYAVDTWKGDEHASFYSEDVFKRVRQINNENFSKFSSLMRMTFDEGLSYFSDNTIDLLHIDGLHTYEAVKHDFETWLPKMSDSGVVIFHDTAVRERGFGVWNFWEEIREKYPSFDFLHGNGLGVLCVGKNVNKDFLKFVNSANKTPEIRNLFATLGNRILALQEKEDLRKEVLELKRNSREAERIISQKEKQIEKQAEKETDLNKSLEAHKATIQRRDKQVGEQQKQIDRQVDKEVSLNKRLEDHKAAIQRRDKKIEDQQNKIARLTEKEVNLNKRLEDHKVAIQRRDKKIEDQQSRIDRQVEKEVNLNKRLEDHKAAIQRRDKKIEELQKQYYDSNNEKNERIGLLREELNRSKSNVTEQKIKILEYKEAVKKRDEQKFKIDQKLKELTTNLESKEREISELSNSLTETLKTLSIKLDVTEKLEKNTEILNKLLLAKSQDIKVSENKNKHLAGVINSKEVKIKSIEREVETLQKSVSQLKQQIEKTEQENNKLKQRVPELEEEITQLSRKLNNRILTKLFRFAKKVFKQTTRIVLFLGKLILFSITFQIKRVKSELLIIKHYRIISKSGLFDKKWYLKKYPDVSKTGINPIIHYLRRGVIEKRNPSQEFNTAFYLQQYGDVYEAGINPLVHYALYGKSEGRNTKSFTQSNYVIKSETKESGVISAKQPKSILYVVHDGGGGMIHTSFDLFRFISKKQSAYIMIAGKQSWKIYQHKDGHEHKVANYSFSSHWKKMHSIDKERCGALKDIYKKFNISLVHIRVLLGTGAGIVDFFKKNGVPVVFSFHDFSAVCPNLTLVCEGKFCAGNCQSVKSETDCRYSRSWFGNVGQLRPAFRSKWSEMIANSISKCDRYVVTSLFTKKIVLKNYPLFESSKFRLIEHGRDFSKTYNFSTKPNKHETINIVFFGALNEPKGIGLVLDMMKHNNAVRGKIVMHVIGEVVGLAKEYESTPNIVIYGKYDRDELFKYFEKIKPSFTLLPSVCHETFSHTLTESWAFGIPPIVSTYGALGERVEREQAGWSLEPIDAKLWYNKIIDLSKNIEEYNLVLDKIQNLKFKTVEQMANEYLAVYDELRGSQGGDNIEILQQGDNINIPFAEDDKTKEQNKRTIRRLRVKLLERGFEERAYAELETIAKRPNNSYIANLAAWELSLWHSNYQNIESAAETLKYLDLINKQGFQVDMQQQIAVIESESLLLTGDAKKAEQVAVSALNKSWNPDLLLAKANTKKQIEDRLSEVNKIYEKYNLATISFKDSRDPLYDQLATNLSPEYETVDSGEKVTIIVPTFNAETTIKTTLDSLQKQTYKNIEIIVVDDCSTDSTLEIVKEYAQRDSRIIYLKTPTNSGPYVARNIALDKAKGTYVTCNDADDWSHAQKIEYQVANLEKNPEIIANISQWTRVTDDFMFSRRNNPGFYMQINLSSMMFRRREVTEKLGFWDSVRYGADTEFHKRMIIVFGQDSIVTLPPVPLSFARLTDTSLTASPIFGYPGFPMGSRKEYRDSYMHFYQDNPNLKYGLNQKTRPFAIPDMMNSNLDSEYIENRHFELIIVSDLRNNDANIITLIESYKKRRNQKRYIGLVNAYIYDLDKGQSISPAIRKLIDGDIVKVLVYGENVTCETLIVAQHRVLTDKQIFLPQIKSKEIFIIVYNIDSEGMPHQKAAHFNQCAANAIDYFGEAGKWVFMDNKIWTEVEQFVFEEIKKHATNSPINIPFTKNKWQLIKLNLPPLKYDDIASKEKITSNNPRILLLDVGQLENFSYYDPNGVMIVMPCIDIKMGFGTAEILHSRAGMDCLVVIAVDTKRQGFIKTLNQVSLKADVAYVVYLAQDAYPGRNWLKTAYEKLEQQQKGLLAFNDGKWNGKIASFGMVRKSWAKELYDNMILYEGYKAHKADNEITVIAKVTQQYIYDPDSSLIEVDYNKDRGGSNPDDDDTFKKRFLSGFDGKVPIELLRPLAKEYSTRNMKLVFANEADEKETTIENNSFILYRIIGNDLIPRHKKGQSYENLKFILDHEPEFANCQKVFILNRIIDLDEEQRIVELLKSKDKNYSIIPFILDDYKKIDVDYQTYDFKTLFGSPDFKKLDPNKQNRAVAAAYRLKNNYIMNNNGARNYALKDGRDKAHWILPFDGNCFFTQPAWDSLVKDVLANADKKYHIVPMCRILDNSALLSDDFFAEPVEEPQIIFRNDSELFFDERFCYGRRPKVELLWRLGVPGKWDSFPRDDNWDIERPTAITEKIWSEAGWVARLYSGNKEMENDTTESAKSRTIARVEAIISTIEHMDVIAHGENAEKLSNILTKGEERK